MLKARFLTLKTSTKVGEDKWEVYMKTVGYEVDYQIRRTGEIVDEFIKGYGDEEQYKKIANMFDNHETKFKQMLRKHLRNYALNA